MNDVSKGALSARVGSSRPLLLLLFAARVGWNGNKGSLSLVFWGDV